MLTSLGIESMLRRLPVVAVFGQGTPIAEDHARLARETGALVARLGAHLLTGGGFGVMEAASQGFVGVPERAGFSIGVIPRDPDGPFDLPHQTLGRRYPNAFVEIVIMTPLPTLVPDWRTMPGRNHVNVLSADAAIVLPGNQGTHNELDMLAEYQGEAGRRPEDRRAILIGPVDRFAARHRELFLHARDLAEVERHVQRVLAARGLAREHMP